MASGSIELIYKNIIAKFFVFDNSGREIVVPERSDRIEIGIQFVMENVSNQDLSAKLQAVVRRQVVSMEVTFWQKWKQLKSKSKDVFERTFEKWVHSTLQLPPSITSPLSNRMRGSTQKKKNFGELSERQKRRRVEELDVLDVDQLLLSAIKAAKHSKRTNLAYVLNVLYKNDEIKAKEIRDLLRNNKRDN